MAQLALLHLNGTNGSTTFTDAVGVRTWTAAGTSALDTGTKQFGSASLKCPASGNNLHTDNFTAVGVWTLDAWVLVTDNTVAHGVMCFQDQSVGNVTAIKFQGNGSGCSYKVSYDGTAANLSGTGSKTSWNANQQYHFAMTYDPVASKYYFYVDGVKDLELASGTQMSMASCKILLGSDGLSGTTTDMWLDEVRYTSACEYPSGTTFTPPSSEYTLLSDISITPAAGALALTGQAPLVAVSKMPVAGALSLTGIAPLVVNSGARNIAPGTATLGLSGTTASLRDRPYPGTAALAMQGYAPVFVVASTTLITPWTGTLSLDTSTPALVRGMTGEVTLHPYAATGSLQTTNSFAGAVTLRKYEAVGYGQFISAPRMRAYHGAGNLVGSFIGAATLRAYRSVQITAAPRLRKYQAAGSLSAAIAAVYRTHTMNTTLNAVTEYTNFNFNSFAEIGGIWYGAGPSGLIKLEGLTDAGANINWQVRTGQTDDKQIGLKRLPEVVLGLRASGPIRVRVYPDDNQYFDYVFPNVKTSTIRQHRVKPGKGMKARYFAVELQGMVNSAIELDSMQINFTPTTRRLG